jgi:hypothetical protein
MLTLPLVNPWVRGDGVGYYAYLHSLLIDHDLRFEDEWLAGNPSFVMNRVDASGRLRPDQYTSTGYVDNHFTIGPAMLWVPFVVPVHYAVRLAHRLGARVPADGYSRPYTVTMALATATYGFLGLLLAFDLARKYFAQRWALLATLGIWFASSLPVYMYFNPSWSHAHSAFVVALFLWYWHRTRTGRTLSQWTVLGLLSGLMVDVYYPNFVFVLVPLLESLRGYGQSWRGRGGAGTAGAWRLFQSNLLYLLAALVGFLPTLVTRTIIYGSPFRFGYSVERLWDWGSPAFWDVLFSADHGLLSWTPILIPAVLGLYFLRRADKELATHLLIVSLAFYYVIASFRVWDGISSFGNRFFISLAPVFVLGLAATLDALGKLWSRQQAASMLAASSVIALFTVWNLGLIFQWGTHLVPARGPIPWREAAYNQVAIVPGRLAQTAKGYLLDRKSQMGRIELQDVEQLKQKEP